MEITQKEVDELKQYLWGKIDELENENRLLKVVIKIGYNYNNSIGNGNSNMLCLGQS